MKTANIPACALEVFYAALHIATDQPASTRLMSVALALDPTINNRQEFRDWAYGNAPFSMSRDADALIADVIDKVYIVSAWPDTK